MWEFIGQHPWFTGIMIVIILMFICEIIEKFKE